MKLFVSSVCIKHPKGTKLWTFWTGAPKAQRISAEYSASILQKDKLNLGIGRLLRSKLIDGKRQQIEPKLPLDIAVCGWGGKVQDRDLAKGLCNMAAAQIRLIIGNIICAITHPGAQWMGERVRKGCRVVERRKMGHEI